MMINELKDYNDKRAKELLWQRYDECYMMARMTGNSEVMTAATDRMASLLGVSFDIEDEDEGGDWD